MLLYNTRIFISEPCLFTLISLVITTHLLYKSVLVLPVLLHHKSQKDVILTYAKAVLCSSCPNPFMPRFHAPTSSATSTQKTTTDTKYGAATTTTTMS